MPGDERDPSDEIIITPKDPYMLIEYLTSSVDLHPMVAMWPKDF